MWDKSGKLTGREKKCLYWSLKIRMQANIFLQDLHKIRVAHESNSFVVCALKEIENLFVLKYIVMHLLNI